MQALTRSGRGDGLPAGVRAVRADLDAPASVRTAATGARAAFLLPGFSDMPGVLAALRYGGVEQVVLLSGSSAGDGDATNAVSRMMAGSEAAVRASGLRWTILRPSGFASNTLEWAPQLAAGDTVRAPFADVAIAVIDPADIAAVAAVALAGGAHDGDVLRLTGPEPLRPADRARILGEVLGRDLRFEAVPDEEARREMAERMPERYVDAFFRFYVDGTLDDSVVLPTVEEVTGAPARTFRQWARANAARFG